MVMNFRISEQRMAQFSQGYKSNEDAGYDDDERRMARRIDRHRSPKEGEGERMATAMKGANYGAEVRGCMG